MSITFETSYTPNAQQLNQLFLLREIVIICRELNLKISIIGGYGLDGLIGKLTRDHDDIDILVVEKDRNKLIKLLKTLGFSLHAEPPGKEVFNNLSFAKNFKIDVLYGTRLAEFVEIGMEEIFPSQPNGHLYDFFFITPTLKGNEFIQLKQTVRAAKENWDYPYRHEEHRAKLIGFLKKITEYKVAEL